MTASPTDTERIDWLSKHDERLPYCADGLWWAFVDRNSPDPTAFDTLRDAVDALILNDPS